MKKRIELIKSTTLFNSLSDEKIENNLKSGVFKVVNYPKNNVIHLDGEICTKLEVILSGKVFIERIDEAGGLLTITEFYFDDILGGNLIYSKSPYYIMTITSKEPTEVLEIDKEVLFDLLFEDREFLRTYLTLISDHAYILGDKIKQHINKPLRESIMYFLDYEQTKQNSNHIVLNTTKKELAERFGVQRSSLSRELAKMRDEGLIKFDRNSITIHYSKI